MTEKNQDISPDEIPIGYKEKKWGKDEDGEFITAGYAFRGKRTFKKALNGVKDLMKKDVENEF